MTRMKCPHGVSPKGNCDICYKESRRKYRQSPAYKECRKKYRQSLKYKEYRKEYQQSSKYKEYLKRYWQSSKYKEYKKKYMKEYMRLHNPKVLNHAPAKPVSPYVVEIKGRVDKPHEETGGGFTIIHMDKITDKKD